MPMRSAASMLGGFGEPSRPRDVAAEGARVQPFSQPLGHYTGAPTQTLLTTEIVAAGNTPTCIVSFTRENRFITLTAPRVGFTIFVGGGSGASVSLSIALVGGVPYEISLPGNQALYAVSNAPVPLRVSIQIAAALAGDLERRLG